jgi:hypothetical protein
MKTSYFFKTLVIFLFLNNYLIAQNKCCLPTTTAPEVASGVHGTGLLSNQNTPAPILSVNASVDLPNLAYIITKKNVPALNDQGQADTTGGGGNVVLGAEEDGIFTYNSKSRYGIGFTDGDTLEITAVGYDLGMIQNLTDSLLNGVSPGSGPCCGLFNVMSVILGNPALAGFCDSLNSMGIYDGSDVTNFEDVLTVLTTFTMLEQLSVESIIFSLNLINDYGAFISANCGGTGANNYMPYGINVTERYAYAIGLTSNTCCSSTTVAPELNTGIHGTLIGTNENTPIPVLNVNASVDLPNVEYVITKRNVAALGQNGNVVIGADEDGVFMPMDKTRYGVTLTVGDTFDITAIGYDLTMFKTLMDSLLNGTANGQPCCDLFGILGAVLNKPHLAGFCDSLNNAGVLGAADLNNMEEMLSVFDVFNNSQTSLESIVTTLELLNDAGTYIASDCGGTGVNDFLPYGMHLKKQYAYLVDNPLVVRNLSSVSLFMLYPNPTNTGLLNVHFTSKQEVNLVIRLFDALGQEVRHQILNNVSGDFKTSISTSNLAAGMYYVELTDGHSNQVLKVIVD